MNFPITRASLNLTRACNLRCTYPCFTNGCTIGDMPKEVAFKAVNWLFANAFMADKNERQVEISFWGGEPLLKWDLLKEITLYAEDVSRKIVVPVTFGGTTNGTLLTKEKFDFLDEHKIFFLVSLDGTQASHDLYRKFSNGQGSHSIVIKNMEKVLKKWPFYRARMSLSADNVSRFYEDVKYLIDFGFKYIIFSPVYETNWTDNAWDIFEEQGYKVVDLIKDKDIEIEHFKSYQGKDNSRWACGAGRNYVGIDIDGAIFPCHRFNKFNSNRPWQEKEVCIGHIDHGITKPEFRQIFIDANHQCGQCTFLESTPCHGGCPAVNFDLTGDPMLPYMGLCKYVEKQKKISEYYKSKVEKFKLQNNGSCICNFEYYTGPIQDQSPKISLDTVAILLADLNNRISILESKQ